MEEEAGTEDPEMDVTYEIDLQCEPEEQEDEAETANKREGRKKSTLNPQLKVDAEKSCPPPQSFARSYAAWGRPPASAGTGYTQTLNTPPTGAGGNWWRSALAGAGPGGRSAARLGGR